MSSDFILGGVGYWFGFSLSAAFHFFARTFELLESSTYGRFVRLALSILLLIGVFCFALFCNYANYTLAGGSAHFSGFLIGITVYFLSALWWRRYGKNAA